jgi:hypothetical protein
VGSIKLLVRDPVFHFDDAVERFAGKQKVFLPHTDGSATRLIIDHEVQLPDPCVLIIDGFSFLDPEPLGKLLAKETRQGRGAFVATDGVLLEVRGFGTF